MPGASDDASVPSNTSYSPTLSSASVTLKSLTTDRTFTVAAGGNLTITNGLTVSSGGTLRTTASNATVTASGPVNITGATLDTAGGTISLPTLTSVTGPLTISASGAGSLIDLSNVASLTTGAGTIGRIAVSASGGVVDLSSATAAVVPAGQPVNRGFSLSADGGGLINLSKLATLTDPTGYTALYAYSGGEVRVPLVGALDGVDIVASGTGSLVNLSKLATLAATNDYSTLRAEYGGEARVPALTALNNVTVTVNGATSALPLGQVTQTTNAAFTATSATLGLTGLTAVTGPLTFTATNAASRIDLSNVASLTTGAGTIGRIAVSASGGVVDLSSATAAVVPAGQPVNRGFSLSADGGGLINLSKLATLTDPTGYTALYAYSGEIRIPLITTLDTVTINTDGSAGTVTIGQITTLTRSSITVYNSAISRAFTSLTNFNGSSLTAYVSSVGLPALANYDNLGYFTQIQGTNGGTVTVPQLSTVTLAGGGTTFGVPALTLNQLSITANATFAGAASTTVAKSFTWTQGYVEGPGVLRLLPGGTGTINTGNYKRLSRTLENAGSLTYSGSSLTLNSGNPGIINNLAGGTLTLTGDGDVVTTGGTGQSFSNAGTLVRTGAGTTTISMPFSSTGSIDVKAGRLETTGGGLTFDGSNTFKLATTASMTLAGSITGSSTATTSYTPVGTLTVSGGTAVAPRLWETMGKDIGGVLAGLTNNAAYGTVILSSAYMKLTDAADNAAGAGAEAIYLDRIVVPAGSTLDLNNLNLYARTAQVDGTVLNGSITLLVAGVRGVTFNGGLAQRSSLTSAEVTFTTSVTLSPGAFVVTRQSNGTTVPFTVGTAYVDGRTVATLTFGTGGLAVGSYNLTVTANLVTGPYGTKLDGDGDGTPGGDYVYAGGDFFRFVGDFDGDGAVDGNDLAALAQAFNSVTGDSRYRAYLDLDGDGAVDGNDLAIFAQRFNTVM